MRDIRPHVALALAFRQGGRASDTTPIRSNWIEASARVVDDIDENETEWWSCILTSEWETPPS